MTFLRPAFCLPRLSAVLLAGVLLAAPTAPVLADDTPYGWPWLVRALDHLKPSADTSLPETSSAAIQRLDEQLATNPAAVLAEVEQRQAAATGPGVDVRLSFLRARALAALGRTSEAMATYRTLTVQFPELPEPWNNLAVLEAAQGNLEAARTALEMALRTDPDYAHAQFNLGDVHLMLAARAYGNAARLGEPGARQRQQAVEQILQPTQGVR